MYKPGDRVYVGVGEACGMNFTDGVWAVEYERGPLPLSLPFGLADELMSCLDFATAGLTVGVYMSLLAHHWRLPLPNGQPSHCPGRKIASSVLGLLGPAMTHIFKPRPASSNIPRR